jgi:rRNA-processing protein FCF1
MKALRELYQEQIRLLEELLFLLKRDAEIIRSGRKEELEELLENNKKKETLALKIKLIEGEKRRLLETGERPKELEEELRSLLKEIFHQGEKNRVLLEESLSLIMALLSVLSPPVTYTPEGRPLMGELLRSRGKA